MGKAQRIAKAMAESAEATARLKAMKRMAGRARPAAGHIPFIGHRTQKTMGAISRRAHHTTARAQEFGYDPDSLNG